MSRTSTGVAVRLDVVIAGDFRLPGGSSRRLAREVDLLVSAGVSVGLVHIQSPLVARPAGWHPELVRAARASDVTILDPATTYEADVVVLRHPSIFMNRQRVPKNVVGARLVVVANQPLTGRAGEPSYVPRAVEANVSGITGASPEWWADSEEVRAELVALADGLSVSTRLWFKESRPSSSDPLESALPSHTAHDDHPTDPAGALLERLLGVARRSAGRPVLAAGPQDDQPRRPTIVFVTSNGAGMGHLTRELGIARAVGADATCVFVSLSQGVPVVAQFGLAYEYVPFSSALEVSANEWNVYGEARFRKAFETYAPDVVVFDGVWPYAGLMSAVRSVGAAAVWVRRGMWKSHISPDQLAKAASFDLVVEPGDYASAYDTGATRGAEGVLRVAPITVVSREEILGREEARDALGLPAEGEIALVTLGAGVINDTASAQDLFVDAVRRLGPGWRPVVTQAKIAGASGGTGTISIYPLARYARAFDVAVSAAGYNSYHEWINALLPTIWLPNTETITDDQEARARFAEDSGMGRSLVAPSPDQILSTTREIADDGCRREMVEQMRRRLEPNGAVEAARAILEVARRKVAAG